MVQGFKGLWFVDERRVKDSVVTLLAKQQFINCRNRGPEANPKIAKIFFILIEPRLRLKLSPRGCVTLNTVDVLYTMYIILCRRFKKYNQLFLFFNALLIRIVMLYSRKNIHFYSLQKTDSRSTKEINNPNSDKRTRSRPDKPHYMF